MGHPRGSGMYLTGVDPRKSLNELYDGTSVDQVAAKAWAALKDEVPLLWIGDPRHLPEGTAWQAVEGPEAAASVCPRALPVLARDFGSHATPGTANPAHAAGVIEAIEAGVALAQGGRASAVCTAPIHKKALADGAGFAYPGHTEFLAALGGVDQVVMMLASSLLKVVPATIHIPLADVPEALTAALLTDTILITHAAEVAREAQRIIEIRDGNIVADGHKSGDRKHYYLYNICDHEACFAEVGSQAISYTTGVPAMIGAKQMLEGKWRKVGVWNMEQLDPDDFMADLNQFGLPWKCVELTHQQAEKLAVI